jgi:hypothetical protein
MLPIRRILWAGNDSSHHDHLHVEGEPGKSGSPPLTNPGMTPSVKAVWNAMTERYGTGYYFTQTPPPEPNWSNMGIFNRRQIAGTTTWSQHAWANAIDIGPLYGSAQQPVYDYLTTYGEDDDMAFTADEEKELKAFVAELKAVGSNAGFIRFLIPDMRKNIVTMDELQAIVSTSGTIDEVARKLAKVNAEKLARIKEAI